MLFTQQPRCASCSRSGGCDLHHDRTDGNVYCTQCWREFYGSFPPRSALLQLETAVVARHAQPQPMQQPQQQRQSAPAVLLTPEDEAKRQRFLKLSAADAPHYSTAARAKAMSVPFCYELLKCLTSSDSWTCRQFELMCWERVLYHHIFQQKKFTRMMSTIPTGPPNMRPLTAAEISLLREVYSVDNDSPPVEIHDCKNFIKRRLEKLLKWKTDAPTRRMQREASLSSPPAGSCDASITTSSSRPTVEATISASPPHGGRESTSAPRPDCIIPIIPRSQFSRPVVSVPSPIDQQDPLQPPQLVKEEIEDQIITMPSATNVVKEVQPPLPPPAAGAAVPDVPTEEREAAAPATAVVVAPEEYYYRSYKAMHREILLECGDIAAVQEQIVFTERSLGRSHGERGAAWELKGIEAALPQVVAAVGRLEAAAMRGDGGAYGPLAQLDWNVWFDKCQRLQLTNDDLAAIHKAFPPSSDAAGDSSCDAPPKRETIAQRFELFMKFCRDVAHLPFLAVAINSRYTCDDIKGELDGLLLDLRNGGEVLAVMEAKDTAVNVVKARAQRERLLECVTNSSKNSCPFEGGDSTSESSDDALLLPALYVNTKISFPRCQLVAPPPQSAVFTSEEATQPPTVGADSGDTLVSPPVDASPSTGAVAETTATAAADPLRPPRVAKKKKTDAAASAATFLPQFVLGKKDFEKFRLKPMERFFFVFPSAPGSDIVPVPAEIAHVAGREMASIWAKILLQLLNSAPLEVQARVLADTAPYPARHDLLQSSLGVDAQEKLRSSCELHHVLGALHASWKRLRDAKSSRKTLMTPHEIFDELVSNHAVDSIVFC